jgi:hypothetical protein
LSIFIHIPGGLTHGETSGYSVTMAFWREAVVLASLALFQPAMATVFAVTLPAEPESVPAADYPFYDLAVDAKFLTSHTRLVVIERMTATHLHPDEPQLPTASWFAEGEVFDGRLPKDLVRDFVAKNQRSSRLDARFAFGVRYRFVSEDGVPDAEASLPAIPAAWPVENEERNPEILDRLAFSRVGLTLRGDQALLYVANQRPDGTGAGFLFWFLRRQTSWEVYDTEVLWVARPEQNSPGSR